MKRAIGVAAGLSAAGVGVVTLIALVGRRVRAAAAEPAADAHMWAVLAGEAAA